MNTFRLLVVGTVAFLFLLAAIWLAIDFLGPVWPQGMGKSLLATYGVAVAVAWVAAAGGLLAHTVVGWFAKADEK